MISLKKHIEEWKSDAPDSLLGAYRSLLSLTGKFSHRAVPVLGRALELQLSELDFDLERNSARPEFRRILATVHEKAGVAISRWAEQAFKHHKATESDLREIVDAMASAVGAIAARDERYAVEVGDLTARLRTITNLTELPAIRRAIVESANSLTTCVAQMAETSGESLRRLSAQVEDYRSRLDKSEKLSALDPLTGLANRRAFEQQLEAKIEAASRFCLILIDLNDFKMVNDRLGHLAGDEVLKSFAGKLRLQFPSADVIARWGGDEFAVIINSSRKDAEARVGRIRRSSIGECRIIVGKQPTAVCVDASLGVVEWDGSESGHQLVSRADSSMYVGKHSMKTALQAG